MNKKEAAKLISFILIFVFVLTRLTYAVRTNGDIKDIFTGFYAEKKDTVDVVIIGSSPVYPFYSSPKLFEDTGITMYPLSSHVQRPSAALPLAKEACRYQSPDVLVFEMRMFTMDDGRMEENMAYARGVTDNMKYSVNRIDAINRLIPSKADWNELMQQDVNDTVNIDHLEDRYTYYFDIFKYHSNWKSLRLLSQLKCMVYYEMNPLKGYVIKDEVCFFDEEDIPSEEVILTDEEMVIPYEQELRLYELLDYLKDNNQMALFIVSPYRVTEDEMKMFNYMNTIIESYNYSFVNFNREYEDMDLDFTTDFYDYGGHVNAEGAKKCTEYLEKELLSFNLTDHRDDEKYKSWGEAARLYDELSNEAIDKINESIANGNYVIIEH